MTSTVDYSDLTYQYTYMALSVGHTYAVRMYVEVSYRASGFARCSRELQSRGSWVRRCETI